MNPANLLQFIANPKRYIFMGIGLIIILMLLCFLVGYFVGVSICEDHYVPIIGELQKQIYSFSPAPDPYQETLDMIKAANITWSS